MPPKSGTAHGLGWWHLQLALLLISIVLTWWVRTVVDLVVLYSSALVAFTILKYPKLLWQFRDVWLYIGLAFTIGYAWYGFWVPIDVQQARRVFLEISSRIDEGRDVESLVQKADGTTKFMDTTSHHVIAEEVGSGERRYFRNGTLFATVKAVYGGVRRTEVTYFDREKRDEWGIAPSFLRDTFDYAGHPILAEYDPQHSGNLTPILSPFPFVLPVVPFGY